MIFMNLENSKTSDAHWLRFNLFDKTNLPRGTKCVSLSDLTIDYTQKNIKKSNKDNKFEISGTRRA